MYNSEKFISRLKELMLENGENTVTLAKKLNISNQAISLWLNNKREPKLSLVCNIANIFNVDLRYLVGIIDEYFLQ